MVDKLSHSLAVLAHRVSQQLYNCFSKTFILHFQLSFGILDSYDEHTCSLEYPFSLSAYLRSTIIVGRPFLKPQQLLFQWLHEMHPVQAHQNGINNILSNIVGNITLLPNTYKEEKDVVILKATETKIKEAFSGIIQIKKKRKKKKTYPYSKITSSYKIVNK